MSGYIFIHKKLLEWEFYSDLNTKALFIRCLLKANWEDKEWNNTTILRGSFVTSVDCLSRELGLSVKKIRLCLDKMKRANNIAVKTTNKYSVITVVKYDDYQKPYSEKGKQKDKQSGTKRATTKEYNIYNNLLSEIEISDVELNLVQYFKIAREFQRLFITNLKEKKASYSIQESATFKSYVDPIRLMIEKKEATRDDLIEVWQYLSSQEGEFWKKNILSTSKLRDKLQQLLMAAREFKGTKKHIKEDKL